MNSEVPESPLSATPPAVPFIVQRQNGKRYFVTPLPPAPLKKRGRGRPREPAGMIMAYDNVSVWMEDAAQQSLGFDGLDMPCVIPFIFQEADGRRFFIVPQHQGQVRKDGIE